MATHKKSKNITKTLLKIIVAIPALFSLISKVTTLIGIEARMAGKSLITILVLSFLFGMLLASTWLGLLAMLCIYLISLHWSIELSLLTVLILNLVLLLIIGLAISKSKKNLFFPVTSTQLTALKKLYED